MMKRAIRSGKAGVSRTGGLTPLEPEGLDEPPTHGTTDSAGADTEDNSFNAMQLIDEIWKKHSDWEVDKHGVDEYLATLRNSSAATHPGTAVAREAEEGISISGAELARKIQEGMSRIQQLDSILLEKTELAKSFSSNNSTSDNLSVRQFDSDADDDDDMEMRSVHSLDTRTFITEPKFVHKPGGGATTREAGKLRDTRERHSNESEGKSVKSLTHKYGLSKGYEKGNFIQRNIILGPDARYYSALTKEEQQRVNSIVNVPENSADVSDKEERPLPLWSDEKDAEEFAKLAELDRKLESLHEYDDKSEIQSLIWAPSASLINFRDDTSSQRDTNSVMNQYLDQSILNDHDYKVRLKEIDETLKNLKDNNEAEVIAPEQIRRY
ncbi:hypothetical protein HDV05_000203 [Chytridiales sp. JEL 0842]|nr:hypothetical protein HDV05_000203 [Chytridiales sp. JEL 0842]